MVMPDEVFGSAEADRDLGLSHRPNPQARMPLLEHIRELRNRVIKVIVAVAVGAIIGWFLYGRIWHFIQAPYCKVPQPQGVFGPKGSCPLYVNGLFDAFFLKLQICIVAGIILTAPVWLYQFWAFIAPGLYHRERRWAYYFVGAAVPLFAVGATIAYFAMTKGIHFLLGQVPAGVHPLITINTYLSYAGAMLALFGITFELPLVFVLLNLAGVLTHERFRKWRRMIIFLIFAFAAIFTPSPDPLSMLLLALPCVALVEASEVFAWLHDRRKARTGSLAYPGLSAEDVARYGLDKPPGDVDVDASAGSSAGS
jgi:sec-independent protein translocase protein TatC